MDNETIAALIGFVIFAVLIFVALFTVARLLLRDRDVYQVRIGFFMERDRDLGEIDEYESPTKVMYQPPKELP